MSTTTNDTTKRILNFFFAQQIFCWRNNTTGIPLKTGGFRPTSKKGVSDIIAICPPSGRFVGVEIKTGKDRLSPEQQGFCVNVQSMGGVALIVSSYEDFLRQWSAINPNPYYVHAG